MSHRQSLQQTLQALIPSISTIAPALLDLAVALYAQSRSKVPYLKPEEEAARECVCCVLAAERLKQRLNLPAITPRPPCAPKVYRKLYQYLDATLKATSVPSSSRDIEPASIIASRPTDISHLPSWVTSSVTHVCKRLKQPAIDMHVLNGVAFLAHPRHNRSKAANFDSLYDPLDKHIPALIAAVSWFVIQRVADIASEESRAESLRLAVEDLISLRKVAVTKSGLCESEANGMLDDLSDSWSDMPWCQVIHSNIDPTLRNQAPTALQTRSNDLEQDSTVLDVADIELDEDGALPLPGDEWPDEAMSDAASLEPRSASRDMESPPSFPKTFTGSMRQSRVDWLSPGKTAEYADWRAAILRQIDTAQRL